MELNTKICIPIITINVARCVLGMSLIFVFTIQVYPQISRIVNYYPTTPLKHVFDILGAYLVVSSYFYRVYH